MKRIIPVVLLLAGLVLLYMGYQEYHSFGSEVDRFFGGSGSDKAIWLLLAGGAALLAGLSGVVKERLKS